MKESIKENRINWAFFSGMTFLALFLCACGVVQMFLNQYFIGICNLVFSISMQVWSVKMLLWGRRVVQMIRDSETTETTESSARA